MNLTVAGLPGGAAAAKVFAAARGREATIVAGVPELLAELTRAPGAVVLSLGPDVDFRTLAEIVRTAHHAGVAIGLIDGWRGTAAAEDHARELADWTGAGRPGVAAWLEESPLVALHGTYGSLDLLDVAAADPAPLLGSTRRVTGLTSHSNGIDSPLGRALLCGLREAEGDALTRYLPCAAGGPCRGAKPGPDGTLERPRLIAPRELPGDVLMLGICDGVLPAHARFDQRGGILRGLLRPGAVRQVVTTYKHWPLDEAAFLAACLLADRGTPLGEVVLMLNAAYLADPATNDDPPWVLVGDPTVALDGGDPEPAAALSGPAGLLRTPGAGPDRAILVGDRDADPLWVAPVPGSALGVWLHDTAQRHEHPVQVVSRHTDEDHRAVHRVWTSGTRLAFTDRVFQDAAEAMPGRFAYPAALAEHVGATVARLRESAPMVAAGIGLSGWNDDLTALAAAESSGWAALHEVVHEAFVRLSLDATPDLERVYGATAVAGPPTEVSCPYCGSRASLTRREVSATGAHRTMLHCDRCANVSDTDAELELAWLDGPDTVTPGEPVEYRVRLGRWPEHGVGAMTGQITLRQLAPTLYDLGPRALLLDARVRRDLVLRWTPPPTLAPGFYNLGAPVVVDGALCTLRRPLTVRGAETP
ncbi:hypothetical protein CFP65_3082 [Kitasatospora sp. MMS16-BH015]|uniref:hypothetical protein n=1 Tax=Kitasatospora sp. MMS16-BH015 TaxID=2018025 RepID=UPI000CA1E453|nr:hypothetical protein [Kitasatospora sp. MMS16-BH015]AUG77890.1 hypothetical protein CFP65_3082 [Kitasatospora sp. MMS16-BH015]